MNDAGIGLDDHVEELGRSLGDELLEPTAIYVGAITSLWEAGIDTRGLSHITGDGFANLLRLEAEVGYALESLPEPQPIFELIGQRGEIAAAEMFRVFNMGVGMVVITPEEHAEAALAALALNGHEGFRLGTVTAEKGVVRIPQHGLVGRFDGRGDSAFRSG
jgi:phosphoribosylformylglycinamidine cyclo-ligase